MAHLLLLSGSPSPTSRTALLLDLVGQRLGGSVERLEVRTLPPGALLKGDASNPFIAAAVAQIEAADAVIVGTPIYKAAYTGLLKAFLDLLPQFALRGKDVLPLATGGTPAHVLAIDYALRPVLTSLGAAHVSQGWFVLDKALRDGTLDEATEASLWPVVQAFADRLDPEPAGA